MSTISAPVSVQSAPATTSAKPAKQVKAPRIDVSALIRNLCQLRLKRPTFRGGSPDVADTYAEAAATWSKAYRAAFKALSDCPVGSSRKCSDGRDRSGPALADYIGGVDNESRNADIKQWSK